MEANEVTRETTATVGMVTDMINAAMKGFADGFDKGTKVGKIKAYTRICAASLAGVLIREMLWTETGKLIDKRKAKKAAKNSEAVNTSKDYDEEVDFTEVKGAKGVDKK